VIQVGPTHLRNTLNLNEGTLRITNGHSFAPLAATFANAGTLELGGTGLAGGVFTPATLLQNTGTIRGHGQLNGHVESSGRIEGDSDTQLLDINGLLEGGGVLKNVRINDTHSPGLPGAEVAAGHLEGLYSLDSAATFIMDIGSTVSGIVHDQLNSTGTVDLSGHLALRIRNLGGGRLVPITGQQFPIMTATSGITGSFVESMFSTLASNVEIDWNVVYTSQQVLLEATRVFFRVPGDYNRNGVVDAEDYLLWRKTLGTNFLVADGNENGQVDSGDYDVWREHFGEIAVEGMSAVDPATTVPEPHIITLLLAALLIQRRRFLQNPVHDVSDW